MAGRALILQIIEGKSRAHFIMDDPAGNSYLQVQPWCWGWAPRALWGCWELRSHGAPGTNGGCWNPCWLCGCLAGRCQGSQELSPVPTERVCPRKGPGAERAALRAHLRAERRAGPQRHENRGLRGGGGPGPVAGAARPCRPPSRTPAGTGTRSGPGLRSRSWGRGSCSCPRAAGPGLGAVSLCWGAGVAAEASPQ